MSELAKVLVSLSLNDLAKTVLGIGGLDMDVIHEKPGITLENGLRIMMGLESAVSSDGPKVFGEGVSESVCGS